ncbi:MAG: apolipoprotein N-acyltransferase [Flaviflexus sp.]|nr:apolipoprotein N-acyltransferase [Flaviflexus sp.]
MTSPARSVLCAARGGAALFGAFPPLGLSLLALPAIAALSGATAGSARRGALAGFVFGLAFFAPLLSWTAIAVGQLLPWLALAVFQSLYMAVLGALWGRLPRRGIASALLMAGSLCGMEVVRSSFPLGGFPWGLLAFSQVSSPLLRTAPYLATAGVTFLTALLGIGLARAIGHLRRREAFSGAVLLTSVAGVLALAVAIPLPTRGADTARVGWVQGGPAHPGENRALSVTRNHRAETERLLERSGELDLIVWPESSSDYDARIKPEAYEEVVAAAKAAGTPLLMGTQSYVEAGRYNEYLAWRGDTVTDAYAKSAPVPFGEYIPYRAIFTRLSSATELITTDMLPGDGPATLTIDHRGRDLVIATPICFEIAIDRVMAEAMKAGSELIVVPVNSASFGKSAESAQQLDQTIFRAVEYGRSAIQVSTVGHSAVIQPNGALTAISPTWQPASGVAQVQLRSETTPAATLSLPLRYLALGALILAFIRAITTERQP